MIARPMFGWIFTALLALAALARAQAPVLDLGAGSPEGHAWLALPVGASDRPVLMHVPPRQGAEPGPAGSPFGVLRKSMELSMPPAGIAAAGARVFVAFNVGERAPSTMFSIGAVASGLGNLWADDTPGRMRSEQPFPPGLRVLRLAARGRTVTALVQDQAGAHRVLSLEGSTWTDRTPEGLRDAMPISDATRLVATAQGLALVDLIAQPMPALRVMQAPDQGERAWQWGGPELLRISPALVQPGSAVLLVGGRWIVAGIVQRSEEPPELRIVEALPDGPRPLAQLAVSGLRWAAAPSARPDRLILALEEPLKAQASAPKASPTGTLLAPPTGEPPSRAYRLVEVSIGSGQVFFDGPAQGTSPIGAPELRALGLALLAIMVVVLVFVLRPDPAGPELSLPEGWALAEPGRRMVAGLVDFVLALLIASRIWGLGVLEVFGAEAMLSGSGPWALLTALGVGLVLSTLGEAFFAASPGKFLMGCRVGRVLIVEGAPELHTPGLRSALIRNTLKWLAPPLATLSLFDAEGRGKPDRLSRTVVVVPAERDPRRTDEQEP